MFQLTHKKEPARTRLTALRIKVVTRAFAWPQALSQVLEWNQFLFFGPEDCEPSAEPEVFGKRGVKVEPEDSGKGGVEWK
jgi:hypothetical protein